MKTYTEIQSLLCNNAESCFNSEDEFAPPLWLVNCVAIALVRMDRTVWRSVVDSQPDLIALVADVVLLDSIDAVVQMRDSFKLALRGYAAAHCRLYAALVAAELRH